MCFEIFEMLHPDTTYYRPIYFLHEMITFTKNIKEKYLLLVKYR